MKKMKKSALTAKAFSARGTGPKPDSVQNTNERENSQ